MNRTWIYLYRVGTTEYRYVAVNRKSADALAQVDGVPASAYVGKY